MPRSGGQRTNFQYYRARRFEIYAKMFIKYVRLNMASKDVRQIQHGDAKWTLRGEWRSAAEITEHYRTGNHQITALLRLFGTEARCDRPQ